MENVFNQSIEIKEKTAAVLLIVFVNYLTKRLKIKHKTAVSQLYYNKEWQ